MVNIVITAAIPLGLANAAHNAVNESTPTLTVASVAVAAASAVGRRYISDESAKIKPSIRGLKEQSKLVQSQSLQYQAPTGIDF